MRLDPSAALAGHPIDEIEVLRVAFEEAPAEAVLEAVLDTFPGQVAMVSSFGAEAAVLLKMIADIDRDLPVLMIDSLLLFEETIDYQRTLSAHLGLRNVQLIRPLAGRPPPRRPRRHAPPARPGRLLRDPQGAAARPGAPALAGVDHRAQALPGLDPRRRCGSSSATATGSRSTRSPAGARRTCATTWTPTPCRSIRWWRGASARSAARPARRRSATDEDDRAGRWRGSEKVECGIHFGADGRILRAAS